MAAEDHALKTDEIIPSGNDQAPEMMVTPMIMASCMPMSIVPATKRDPTPAGSCENSTLSGVETDIS